tara:strand:- start:2586 stop:3122 length:537 start_codon:yes stop_codon:yes gene_type:complete
MTSLLKFGALFGFLGGALRIVAIFIPYTPETAWLEALYAVIDLGFLFGLLATYLSTADTLRLPGLTGFIIALSGVASIVGPEAQIFDIDFYWLGSSIFVTGLAILSTDLLRAGQMRVTAGFWLASALAGVVSIWSASPFAFEIAGAALGCGFIVAGLTAIKSPRPLCLSVNPIGLSER